MPLVVDAGEGQALEFTFQQVAPGIDIVLPGLGPEPVLHLGPGAEVFRYPSPGCNQSRLGTPSLLVRISPVPRSPGYRSGARWTRSPWRHGSDAPLRCARGRQNPAGGAVGEVHHVALQGKHVHPVLGHLETELLGDVLGIAGLLVPVQHLPQPGDFSS